MSLLINYKLDGTTNNYASNINENDFKILSNNFSKSFQTSDAQGTYLLSNRVDLIFGIPYINNYTSIYNTSPWQIDFEMCSLGEIPLSSTGIFSLKNNNVAYAIYFDGKSPSSDNNTNQEEDEIIFNNEGNYTVKYESFKPPSSISKRYYRRIIEIEFEYNSVTYVINFGSQKNLGASSQEDSSYPDEGYFYMRSFNPSDKYVKKMNIYIEWNNNVMIDSICESNENGYSFSLKDQIKYIPKLEESYDNCAVNLKIKITNPFVIKNPNAISTKKNIEITRQSTTTWKKYSIISNQNIIYTYIDGGLIDKYSRSFNLDSSTVNMSIGSLDNNVLCGIKNIRVYYGESTALSKVDYYHDVTSSIIIRKATSEVPLEAVIPFPYKQFTDMEFILSDTYKNFISDKYYIRKDDTHIYITLENVKKLNLNDSDELRFTFCHNKGFYSVNKIEYHITSVSNQYSYKVDTPFGELVNLDSRYKVFYDRKLIYPDSDINYKFDIQEGILTFNSDFKIENGKDIDIVVFYTGNSFNRTVATLPMSGYITLKKHEIDRNYNKNLMGVFVNGKLVDRDNIIDMSNNIHKISKDIKSRYNLEVKSFSPLINSLVPFYKKNSHKIDIPKQYKYHEFPCIINVPYPNKKHNRKQLFDTELDPIVLNGLDQNNWITLIHHGYQDAQDLDTVLRYDLYFYRDDYEPNPENINVLSQIRKSGNFNQFTWYIDSNSIVLLGKVNSHLTASLVDEPLMSIKIKTIIDQDSTQNTGIIDGVICRFGVLSNTKESYNPIYYTLETNAYEKDNLVGVFEWVISTEQNAKGKIIYRKTVYLEPDNDPYENVT